VFWSLSLPEWRALTLPARAATPLDRSELDTLMRRYPDGGPSRSRGDAES
jgi:uncharacterized phage protein (TIGR02216 family)